MYISSTYTSLLGSYVTIRLDDRMELGGMIDNAQQSAASLVI
jgi:hypothetical protein